MMNEQAAGGSSSTGAYLVTACFTMNLVLKLNDPHGLLVTHTPRV